MCSGSMQCVSFPLVPEAPSSLSLYGWTVGCRVPLKAQTLTRTSTGLRPSLDTEVTGNLLAPRLTPGAMQTRRLRVREDPVTKHWASLSQPNWDNHRRAKSAGVWVHGGASRIQAELLSRAGETLTGDSVDGAEGPQHTHRSDGREAHVVSVQRVLHHAGGAGVLREGSPSPITTTRRPMGAINVKVCILSNLSLSQVSALRMRFQGFPSMLR